jgi:RNA polymerase sigma factor (sigma-70 family)
MCELNRLAQLVVDRAAALTLYARHWLDAASAEDVVQEALTRLLMLSQPPDDPVAWMHRAVRNAAIDHAKTAARRRRREEAQAQARREWFEAPPDALIDARAAEQALRQLPSHLSEIVVLRIWCAMGFVPIAQILQLSPSTVHERYVSALAQMRNALEKPCPNKMD